MSKRTKTHKFNQGDLVWFIGSPGGGLKPGLYTYEGETPAFDGYDNTEFRLISRYITSPITKKHLDGSTSKAKLGRKSTWSVHKTELKVPTEAQLILFGQAKLLK